MALILDGSLGITTPAETVQGALTTTGNTILGDAATDTLNVGNGGLVKDASGNVGIGTSSPNGPLDVNAAIPRVVMSISGTVKGQMNIAGSAMNFTANDATYPMTFNTGGTEQARITAAGLLQFNSGYGSAATAYGCRAWVNFNGTGTVAIRGSGNVSSITDNGAGDYTVNFTTAMPDANISVAGSAKEADSGTTDAVFKIVEVASNPSASSVRVMTGGASSAWDSTVVMVSIFR